LQYIVNNSTTIQPPQLDIVHVRRFQHEVRASISTCDAIFIRQHKAVSSVGGAENAGVENAERQRVESPIKKRRTGPITYQRLEQCGYCDNYCKNTKAVAE